MTIKDWPQNEQPRDKLLRCGAEYLSDAELLAIFLRTGVKGQTAVDVARNALNTFRGLRPLLETQLENFCQFPGLGPVKYLQLQAALELGRRYLETFLVTEDILNNPEDTYNYLIAKLRHRQQEIFACIFLDSHNHIICYEELFQGGLTSSNVYPREVVRCALRHNAAGAIITHNHPSGNATPSDADKALTAQLQAALALIDTILLDHIIIGEGDVFSFAAHDPKF